MNSPVSFLGKCVTVLIGAGLSWLTLTNPAIDQVASNFCGVSALANDEAAASEMFAPVTVSLAEPGFTGDTQLSVAAVPKTLITEAALSAEAASTHDADTPVIAVSAPPAARLAPSRPADRIEEISAELRHLGVSYLLLEKLELPKGLRYRVRCDLAQPGRTVKCCFEATRPTPVEAMEDALRAVRANAQVLHTPAQGWLADSLSAT